MISINRVFLPIILIFLVLNLYFLFENFVYHDEGMILQYADRIVRGQVPYLDFFTQVTPGTYYLNALGQLIYPYAITGRVISLAFGFIYLLMIYSILSNIPDNNSSFFGALFLIFWGHIHWNFPYYSWDAALFYVASCWAFLIWRRDEKLSYVFISGFATILAFLFKQNIGLMSFLVLAFLLLVEQVKCRKLFYLPMAIYVLVFSMGVGFFFFSSEYFFNIKSFDLFSILFGSGVSNKGGITRLILNFAPRVGVINLIFFLLIVLSEFGQFININSNNIKRINNSIGVFFLLIFTYLILKNGVDSFIFLYDFLFIYFSINSFSKLVKKEIDTSFVLYVFSLGLMISNSLVGPHFNRKVVSLSLGGACFFSFIAKEVFYRDKRGKIASLLIFILFLINGMNMKLENIIFRRLSPPLNQHVSSSSIARLKYLRLDEGNMKVIRDISEKVMNLTSKGEDIFVYFGLPFIYYITERNNPTMFDFFWWDITPEVVIKDALKQVDMLNVPVIILSKKLNLLGTEYNKYVEEVLIPLIEPLLSKKYKKVMTSGAVEIYKIKNLE